MRPYICISGLTTVDQVQAVVADLPKNPHHRLMLGFNVSQTSLRQPTATLPKRTISPKQVGQLLHHNSDLHIVNIVNFNVQDQTTLLQDMLNLHQLIGPGLHGIRLDTVWPNSNTLALYRLHHPHYLLILNLHSTNFKAVRNNPKRLANRLDKYFPYLDAILINSNGEDKGINQDLIIACLRELTQHSQIDIGVAGRLHAGNLHILKPLEGYFTNLSITAESGLCNNKGILSPQQILDYRTAAYKLLEDNQPPP